MDEGNSKNGVDPNCDTFYNAYRIDCWDKAEYTIRRHAMNEKPFGKTDIERINTPEQLNAYIRVANPAVWLVLTAAALLLIGVLIWGIFGTVETTLNAGVVVAGKAATCYITAENADRVEPGMTVSVGAAVGSIISVDDTPFPAAGLSDSLNELAGFAVEDICCAARLDLSGVPDGEYAASVAISSIRPISFVIH